jgi:hypothetical protein
MKSDTILSGAAVVAIAGAIALVMLTPSPALAGTCPPGAYCTAVCYPEGTITVNCAQCSRDGGVHYDCKCPFPPGFSIIYNACPDGRFPRAGCCYSDCH